MELKIADGDYTKNSLHDLMAVGGVDEIAERMMTKLIARRGGFALMPNFGSELYKLGSVKASERNSYAKAYIAAALADENVQIDEISITELEDKLTVSVTIQYNGDTIKLETEI